MRRRSIFWTACFAGILIALAIIIQIRNANADFGFLGRVSRIPHFDKMGHFLVMGTLGYCAISAAKFWRAEKGLKFTLKVMTFLALISGLEECAQAWVPSRTLSFGDFAASVSGIVFFGCLAHRKTNAALNRPTSPPPSGSP